MNLNEYADAINTEIILTRYPNQSGRWCAKFDRCELLEGSCLIAEYGTGTTPEAAMKNYLKQIEGGKIVFHAFDDKFRREFTVPLGIEVF